MRGQRAVARAFDQQPRVLRHLMADLRGGADRRLCGFDTVFAHDDVGDARAAALLHSLEHGPADGTEADQRDGLGSAEHVDRVSLKRGAEGRGRSVWRRTSMALAPGRRGR